MSELNAAFLLTDWSPALNTNNVTRAVDLWADIVLSIEDKIVPLKMFFSRPGSKPWYSPFLCWLHHVRDRLFRRSKFLPHEHHSLT